MQAQVLVTQEYEDWFDALNLYQKKAVRRVVGMLEIMGVTLPFPYSSAIKDTKYPLRELRVKAKGDQIRVIYAFDPERNALLIIGGDKVGDDRFYERIIPLSEKIWEDYSD